MGLRASWLFDSSQSGFLSRMSRFFHEQGVARLRTRSGRRLGRYFCGGALWAEPLPSAFAVSRSTNF